MKRTVFFYILCIFSIFSSCQEKENMPQDYNPNETVWESTKIIGDDWTQTDKLEFSENTYFYSKIWTFENNIEIKNFYHGNYAYTTTGSLILITPMHLDEYDDWASSSTSIYTIKDSMLIESGGLEYTKTSNFSDNTELKGTTWEFLNSRDKTHYSCVFEETTCISTVTQEDGRSEEINGTYVYDSPSAYIELSFSHYGEDMSPDGKIKATIQGNKMEFNNFGTLIIGSEGVEYGQIILTKVDS